MTRYLTNRIILSVVMLWVTATSLFFFIHLLPGDPALIILGGEESSPTPEQIARMHHRLGLDRPLHEQYLKYLSGIVRGDLGISFLTGRPVPMVIRMCGMQEAVGKATLKGAGIDAFDDLAAAARAVVDSAGAG